MFVGIGPESDVDSYLEGVGVAEITEIELDTHYLTNAAIQREITPAPPSEQTFWVAAAEGHGAQSVVWDLEPGQWKVVIMNADATPDVAVEVFAGARTAWFTFSIIALLAGGLGLAAGAGLAFVGAFGRSTGSR